MSQNGTIDLNDHAFRLLYSRRENDRLVARIVAEKEGVVKAQIEPEQDGKNQAEAFVALRRHIEIHLDYILKDVPGATSSERYSDLDKQQVTAGPSSSSARSPPISPVGQPTRPVNLEPGQRSNNTMPIDAPPAYGKAVKEWRSDETKS